MSSPFFDRAKLPAKLDDVCREFPFPLAVTYRRVWEEIEADQPIPATLQLKDAFEALLKFLAAASVADCLSADPGREAAGKLVEKLFKPLTDGEWYSLLFDSLKVVKDDPAHAGRRTWPQLADLLFKPNGDATDTRNTLIGTNKKMGFVKWRNSELGHGAFRRDRQHYAAQVVEWLPKLNACLTALRPLLAGRRLRGTAPDGQPIEWTGDGGLPHVAPHTHTPWGEPIALTLDGPDGRSLAFGPLLTMQTCSQPTCRQPAAFFFEGNEFKDPKHKTFFLEYLLGHTQTVKDWPAVRDLAQHLPDKFTFRRDSYDHAKLAEAVKVVFRDAAAEYVRPDYLLDDFWALRDSRPTGYYLWEGEQGVGKSYLMHGLDEDGGEKGVTVLRYHILPGDATRYQTFIVELAERQREKLRMTTQQVQTLVNRHAELPKQFAAFVEEVMTANQLSGLIVAIDALDELRDPASPTDALITDFLPQPAELPKGCVIALTTRSTVGPRVRAKLDALGLPAEARVVIDPKSERNRAAVAKALTERRVEGEEPLTPEKAERLVELAGGVFLYASYFARALAVNAYAGLDDLPPPERFFADFLKRLGERVGESLFATVYMRTLMLLTAGRTPVTRQQLVRWGVPADRLQFAFQDLREFVHELRHRDFHEGLSDDAEPRYKIAHEAFVRYVESHETDRLKDAHRTIATAALRHNETKWEDLDPADDADLYDVRFVRQHCDAAGMSAEAGDPRPSETWLERVSEIGEHLERCQRHHLAEEISRLAADLWWEFYLSSSDPYYGLQYYLASGIRVAAMFSVGQFSEALKIIDATQPTLHALRDFLPAVHTDSLLARALGRKGSVLAKVSKPESGIAYLNEAILIAERWQSKSTEADISLNTLEEMRDVLVEAYNAKGGIFLELGRYEEALVVFQNAIDYNMQREELSEVRDVSTAGYLSNIALTYTRLGLLNEGVAATDRAIGLLRPLGTSGQHNVIEKLCRVMNVRCNLLDSLGHFFQASEGYAELIALLRPLVVTANRWELGSDLASALTNRAVALAHGGRPTEAARDADEAITLYRRLVTEHQREDVEQFLAAALTNRAAVANRSGDRNGYSDQVDEAIEVCRRIHQRAGSVQSVRSLVIATINRGALREEAGRYEEAVSDYRVAIDLLRPVVQTHHVPELTIFLAQALGYVGNTFLNTKRFTEAVAQYEEAIGLLDSSPPGPETMERDSVLASFCMNQGLMYEQLGENKRAQSRYIRARGTLERLYSSGMHDQLFNLLKAYGNCWDLAVKMADWPAAVDAFLAGTKVYQEKVRAGGLSDQEQVGFTRLTERVGLLTPEQREQLLEAAGGHCELFRQWLTPTP